MTVRRGGGILPFVASVLAEIGIDLPEDVPERLTDDVVRGA